ncbi:lipid A export permease/ATP-binding protein MsbA [Aliikangiella marina]|uniref:Lipid A export permease/ATP-binding protein MsbA n=1 Tax=Aliikangiella marina TaxID=1712262 RepID=A0A545TJ94_9GAMM|nr:lipid A export permease/ATP-binding protein MsbA [Aliikangiella marina]TQV77302.1 lipid A export permease/ATP-binding protein MsbA [Aliikangiella marina]
MSKEKIEQGTFKRLVKYFTVSHLRLVLIIAILGNIIYAAMDAWFIALFEPLTDEGLVNNNLDIMRMAPLVILGLFTVRGFAGIVSNYCMAWAGQKVVQKLRNQLVDSYLFLPSRFYDETTAGKLISKVTFNTQQVANASAEAITKLVREGASIIFAIVYMFSTDWRLASIYFVGVPIIAVLVAVTSKRFKNVSKNIQDAMGDVTQTSQEIVEGFQVIKTFNGEDYEKKRFYAVVNRNRQQNLKFMLTRAISVPLIQLIAAIAMSLVVYYSVFLFEDGSLSSGEFVAMFLMMGFVFKPLKNISNLNSVIQQGLAAAQDIFATIDLEKEIDSGLAELTSMPKKIEFSHVSFSYESSDRKVIDDVSFDVNQGETVALVGHSGSGKSTLTNLLLRFYSPDSGQILFDGQSIENFTLDSLRSNVALVSQQVTLFNTSVKDNIAYGQETIDEARLIDAAEKAHASEFIDKLSKGFDSLVGENGSKLSGGQRQRLAIARAIYKNAPLIIMDEATSALDTKSERHIQAAMEALTKDRTTLVIAHRLSTIENADKIIVMDAGKIVEQGQHQALLALNGTYAKLHSTQFSDE